MEVAVSHYMIEGNILPNWSGSIQQTVNGVGRGAFDGLSNAFQNYHLAIQDQGLQYQVNVIWHDEGGGQMILLAVIVEAGIQDQGSKVWWKVASIISCESDKVEFVVSLVVGRLR
jgi:hypothetical protein